MKLCRETVQSKPFLAPLDSLDALKIPWMPLESYGGLKRGVMVAWVLAQRIRELNSAAKVLDSTSSEAEKLVRIRDGDAVLANSWNGECVGADQPLSQQAFRAGCACADPSLCQVSEEI